MRPTVAQGEFFFFTFCLWEGIGLNEPSDPSNTEILVLLLCLLQFLKNQQHTIQADNSRRDPAAPAGSSGWEGQRPEPGLLRRPGSEVLRPARFPLGR